MLCELCGRENTRIYNTAFGIPQYITSIDEKIDGIVYTKVDNPEYRKYQFCGVDLNLVNKMRKKLNNVNAAIEHARAYRLANPIGEPIIVEHNREHETNEQIVERQKVRMDLINKGLL